MVSGRGEVRLDSDDVAELLLRHLENLKGNVDMVVRLTRMALGLHKHERGSAPKLTARAHTRSKDHSGELDEIESAMDALLPEAELEDLSDGLGAIARLPVRGLTFDDLDDGNLYTVEQAAEVFGKSEHTVRGWARGGLLKNTKVGKGGRGGGTYRFTGLELKRYHDKQQELNV